MAITDTKHPDYNKAISSWGKYRDAYEGGDAFVERYLMKFSVREDAGDFAERKSVSYCPRFAGGAVDETAQAIFQRLVDVTRNGDEEMLNIWEGHNLGVDLKGNSMNSFLGSKIVPELLAISKVGLLVDMPAIEAQATMADTVEARPFITRYIAENILSWAYDNLTGTLTSVLLKERINVLDEETQLPSDQEDQFRLLRLNPGGGVSVTFYDKDGEQTSTAVLDIPRIPFITLEINHSLLADTARYQIAMLNMASADVIYTIKANYPLYVEQYDARAELPDVGGFSADDYGDTETGDDALAITVEKDSLDSSASAETGLQQARRYPIGAEAPRFINPSSEPIKVSIEKQAQLKEEIRMLTNLRLETARPKMSSAASKEMDDRGLEAGLSAVGTILEHAERELASFWYGFVGSTAEVKIKYPEKWKILTEAERNDRLKTITTLRDELPSLQARRFLNIEVAALLLKDNIDKLSWMQVKQEIMDALSATANPETIRHLIEEGVISRETGVQVLGYPPEEAEKANAEHAERLERIKDAQDSNVGAGSVPDLDSDSGEADDEKSVSQNADTNPDGGGKKTRGDA